MLLGPIVEFRSKYVEPIQAGLYQDSTPYERRTSLKMLGVLKEDLGPKVHRADMSVLRNDLPPKKEFVITVPLTAIQRKAYSIYVRSMIAGSAYERTKSGEITQTTIWHW
jgi:SNF2 family DNA or RNA helicase